MRAKASLLPFLRRCLYITVFATLVALAGISLLSPQANAGATIPGGTVPPGTLPPPGPAGQGQVNVIHLAPFDPVIANTAVDVCTEAGTPVTGATNLHYLEQSGYLTLPQGNYDWKVMTPGCGSLIVNLDPFTLFDQAVLSVLIIGDGVNQPFDSVLIVQDRGLSLKKYLPLIYKQP